MPKKKIEKPNHISASQISLGRCLRKYHLMRLTREIESDSMPAQVGSCMHDIIFSYTKACVEGKTESDYEMLTKIIEKCFDKYKLPESEYQEIRKNALAFGEKGVEFDKILEYEKHETVEFEPGKKIEVVIDRTNLYRDPHKGTVLEIIDYKNSMKIFSKQDVETLDQLLIYKYIGCTFLYPNINWVRVGIHQTRYNFIRWGELQSVKELSEEFENTGAFLSRQWSRLIESEKYPPGKCEECWLYGGCDVMLAGKCRLFSKAAVKRLKEGNIPDKVCAARKLKIDFGELESQARGHYSNKPPETVAGKKVGYTASISYKYKLKGLLDYCERHSIPIDMLTLSKSEAEKAINLIKPIRKMTEEDMKELAEIQIETATNKFNI